MIGRFSGSRLILKTQIPRIQQRCVITLSVSETLASDLEQDGVTTEQLESVHGVRVNSHYGVVIVDSIVHDEAVGRLLPVEDRCREVFLVASFSFLLHFRTAHTEQHVSARATQEKNIRIACDARDVRGWPSISHDSNELR